MTEASTEPDPWQNRHTDLPAGGPEFGRLVTAMRRLEDVVAMIAPPEDDAGQAADDIEQLAASLEKWQAGEWERYAGRRRDLPGRGHPMLLPFTVDERTDTSVRGRVVFGPAHLGGNGAAHGGTLPLLFDEVLGIMVSTNEPPPPARTAYLTTNYRAITPVGVELRVEASIDRVDGRKRWATGRLYDGERLVADAEGLFVKLRPGMP
jgi:acyl-coenzyme A thioesterase PaaI-like protein